MLSAPPDPQRGEDVLVWAQRINRLVAWLIPRQSPDIQPESNSGGTRWRVKAGSTAALAIPDFSLYDAGGGKLGIDNGTVNTALPTGMTEGATRGSDAAFTSAIDGAGTAYLEVTVDTTTRAITSITIGLGAVPDDTETTGHRALGDYSVADAIISIGSGKRGIGNQSYLYDRWRDWFSDPIIYSHAHQWGPA